MKFIEIPVNKMSLSRRKPILGVGINDANYMVCQKINGKQFKCPYYKTWSSMLRRCYCDKCHKEYPTYKECSVCDEWLTFSNFKNWMEKQDWQGKELDKDLLIQGNKVYSEDTCLFVCNKVNLLINNNKSQRGGYPQGVCWHKASSKVRAQCRVGNKKIHIGIFETAHEAYQAYKEFKYKVIKEVAEQ